jgi:hypothetical protein
MMARRGVVVLALLLAACAAVVREPGPPPPRPGEPIRTWKRETADRAGTILFARNDTTMALIATFRLFDCVNVDQPCGELPARTLEPGVVVEVITVRQVNPRLDHTFNFSYTARPQ